MVIGLTLKFFIEKLISINIVCVNVLPLSFEIRDELACIDIHNVDNYCFAWPVAAGLYSIEHQPQRIFENTTFRK